VPEAFWKEAQSATSKKLAVSPVAPQSSRRRKITTGILLLVVYVTACALPWLLFAFGPTRSWRATASYVGDGILTVGSLILIRGFVFQSRLWNRLTSGPVWLKVAGVTVSVSWFVGAFAAAFAQAAHDSSACFGLGTPVTHVDILYFTVTTFTTLGSNLYPSSHPCKLLVIGQTLLGLVLVGGGIAGLVARMLDRG
jgi:hypothetical protein